MSSRSTESCLPVRNLWLILGLVCAAFIALIALPTTSEAIPAYARQFHAACGMCHAPVPPRLNNFGIRFKRMGYRLPDIDDEGKLNLKDKPSRSVFEDFSLVGDIRGESTREEANGLKLDELMAIGGGAINTHLAYQAELSYADGQVMLETLEGHLIGDVRKSTSPRGSACWCRKSGPSAIHSA